MKHFNYTNFFGEDDLVCIRKSACKWVEPPHTHEFIEFVYIASGKGWHSIEGTRYNVHKGCFLFVNFGQEHEMETTEDTVYYNILFKPEFLERLLADIDNTFGVLMLKDFQNLMSDKPMILFSGSDLLMMDAFVESLFDEYQSNRPGRLTMLKSYIMLILTQVLRKMSGVGIKHADVRVKRISEDILDFIDKHYNEKLSLSELSKMCLYNPSYFSAMFRKHYGITITDYIQKKHIENACRMLRETDLSVDEIGRMIGYDDDVRFYRYFKKICGTSPNEYRKSQIKK